jgi:hypothetical protein
MATNLRGRLCTIVACGALLASCGGGGDGGSSGGCELVTDGPSKLTIRNNLPTGVEAYLPQFAFAADMYSGECVVIGLDPGTTTFIRVELTQCNNSFSNSDCTGRLVPPTRAVTVNLPEGGAATLEVNASLF